MALDLKRIALALLATGVLFMVVQPVPAQSETTDPLAQSIQALDYEKLKALLPDILKYRKKEDWQGVDNVVVAGVPYTLVFLRQSSTDLTWAAMREYLPAQVQAKPSFAPTDEQVIDYVHKLAVVAGKNYTAEAMAAFEAKKDEYMKMYPDEQSEEQVARYVNEPYHFNQNWQISEKAQRAHNEYLALMMVYDALMLRQELKGKL